MLIRFIVVSVFLSLCSAANATIITLSEFDGTEMLFDFEDVTPPEGIEREEIFTAADFSIESISGVYMLQSSAGSLIGGEGAAFNTRGEPDFIGNDARIVFNNTVSVFGMLFGTAGDISVLAGTVSSFDIDGNLIDQFTFSDFSNGFVGFASTAGIKSIFVDRTDGLGWFTFIDDIRYKSNMTDPTRVPEPLSFSIFGIALLALLKSKRSSS